MAISQNSRIDRSDINSMYTSFNNFISSYGGGMAGVGNAPGQYTTIYASTITNLNNKIDNFKSDTYLGTQSSWWSKASNVAQGRIIYASDMNPLVTTVSNFSKVKCRNTANNTYGNNANCCNSNAKACANANNNPQTCSHNCSNCCNSNAKSCANANNNPQSCSHSAHSNCCNSNAKACANANNNPQSCSHSAHSNCCNSNARACGNANNTAQACTSKTCSNWETTCNLLCGQNDQSCAWSCAPQGNCPVAGRVNNSTVCNLLGYSVSPYQCYQHANFCVWGCSQNYSGCSATVIRCNKTCSYSTHSNCCNSNAAACANSNNNPQTCSHNCSNCCNSNAASCANANNNPQTCSHNCSNCCNSNAKSCANSNNNPQSCSHSSHANCCNSNAKTCANTNYGQSCNPRGTTIDITCQQSTKTKT